MVDIVYFLAPWSSIWTKVLAAPTAGTHYDSNNLLEQSLDDRCFFIICVCFLFSVLALILFYWQKIYTMKNLDNGVLVMALVLSFIIIIIYVIFFFSFEKCPTPTK